MKHPSFLNRQLLATISSKRRSKGVERRWAFLLGMASVACSAALGEDTGDDGFATGPTMLPGDNCRSCHGGPSSQYPEAPDWTVAGTVFESAESDVGASGVRVLIRDIGGKTLELTTNSAGNFYTDTSLEFPYWVSLEKDGVVVDMPAPPPSGGCNACHNDPPIGSAPGRLFLPESGTYESGGECDEDGETLVVGMTRYACAPFVCVDASDNADAHCLTACEDDADCATGSCESEICAE